MQHANAFSKKKTQLVYPLQPSLSHNLLSTGQLCNNWVLISSKSWELSCHHMWLQGGCRCSSITDKLQLDYKKPLQSVNNRRLE